MPFLPNPGFVYFKLSKKNITQPAKSVEQFGEKIINRALMVAPTGNRDTQVWYKKGCEGGQMIDSPSEDRKANQDSLR